MKLAVCDLCADTFRVTALGLRRPGLWSPYCWEPLLFPRATCNVFVCLTRALIQRPYGVQLVTSAWQWCIVLVSRLLFQVLK